MARYTVTNDSDFASSKIRAAAASSELLTFGGLDPESSDEEKLGNIESDSITLGSPSPWRSLRLRPLPTRESWELQLEVEGSTGSGRSGWIQISFRTLIRIKLVHKQAKDCSC